MCSRLLLNDGRQTPEIGRSRRAAERNDRPQGVVAMAASTILFVDHVQDSCTSLPDVIWDLDHQGSGAYAGPAARELSRRYTSGLPLLDSRSPGTAGVQVTAAPRI
jgi:hypothetical protein